MYIHTCIYIHVNLHARIGTCTWYMWLLGGSAPPEVCQATPRREAKNLRSDDTKIMLSLSRCIISVQTRICLKILRRFLKHGKQHLSANWAHLSKCNCLVWLTELPNTLCCKCLQLLIITKQMNRLKCPARTLSKQLEGCFDVWRADVGIGVTSGVSSPPPFLFVVELPKAPGTERWRRGCDDGIVPVSTRPRTSKGLFLSTNSVAACDAGWLVMFSARCWQAHIWWWRRSTCLYYSLQYSCTIATTAVGNKNLPGCLTLSLTR